MSAAAPERNIPISATWLSLGQALAWVAFQSTETDWNEKFYFGAAAWPFATPAEVMEWLKDVEAYGDPWDARPAIFYGSLPGYLVQHAAQPGTEDAYKQAAKTMRTKLTDEWDRVTEQYASIRDASESLRRALAKNDGTIKAFGWRGDAPSADEPRSTDFPRIQIPAGVCAGPITVSPYGLLPFVPGDLIDDGWTTLWHGVLIQKDELLARWPSPNENTNPPIFQQQAPTPRAKDQGGRSRHKQFIPFVREMVRRANSIDGLGEDRDEFKKEMLDWVLGLADADTPSDTSVSDWIKELWPSPEAAPETSSKKPGN
jgi:hypothetical protein